MISPRAVLAALGPLLLALSGLAAGQVGARVHTVGWLVQGSPASVADQADVLRGALGQFGYTDQSLRIEMRFAEGDATRLRTLAADLVARKVDVLVASGTPATLAAKRASATIPIVMISTGDPIGSGLIASLARPGGNVTGVSAAFGEIGVKLLELLQEAVPGIRQVGFLGNAANPANVVSMKHVEQAASGRGVTVAYASATKGDEVGAALATLTRARVQGVIVSGDSVLRSQRRAITDFVARARLPAAYFGADYVEAGGLMSYGPNRQALARQAAGYVDRILRGAVAGALPVEEPRGFDLVIRASTARALGLKIPPALLLRADRVIED